MITVGITGNIGSGKTTVCKVFEHLGIAVFYSDAVAKSFYNNDDVKNTIKEAFTSAIFTPDGEVDRKKLASLVFADVRLLKKLNSIIHPLVFQCFTVWKNEHQSQKYLLFESAILYQCGFETLFDKIIWVRTPKKDALNRVMKRDNLSENEVKIRLKNQSINNLKCKLADFCIDNSEHSLIMPQILQIHQNLLKISTKK
ncbi:MAG: dephospho-CoA kinase [Bacteroidales bacterium]|jgi:dephospho-CoA kinase|nr:dephospho-CoA kinase [Bacteroidales bacterium]